MRPLSYERGLDTPSIHTNELKSWFLSSFVCSRYTHQINVTTDSGYQGLQYHNLRKSAT
jgi:hypothetical protein